ncbi:Transposase zinc-binding domain-containing protein, partial [Fusobacterium necrophorum]
MIKEILLLTNLTHIFNFIKSFVAHEHLEFIKFSLDKFLLCRDISKGFVKYSCKKCGHFHTFPISCKSKLCPTCGFKYSSVWAS